MGIEQQVAAQVLQLFLVYFFQVEGSSLSTTINFIFAIGLEPYHKIETRAIRNIIVQANGNYPSSPSMQLGQFTGAPLSASSYKVSDPVVQMLIPDMLSQMMIEFQSEANINGNPRTTVTNGVSTTSTIWAPNCNQALSLMNYAVPGGSSILPTGCSASPVLFPAACIVGQGFSFNNTLPSGCP